jgi:DNA polymerase-3 subunit epsilon|tara:strand:- start:131 stop:823 length:693 start_codon:yes stop_codon:yes gene_type:complete
MRQLILDTETTGISPESGHRVIEIGVVEIIDRRVTGNDYQTYLNPERKIDPASIPIHGITDDFVSNKPKFSEVISEFIDYIEGSEVIMHNAPFDSSFINKELELLGYKDRLEDLCQITDSLTIAREKHPGQRNSLDALINRYEVDGSSRDLHGALIDAKLLARVYLLMTGGQVGFFSNDDKDDKGIHSSTERFDYSDRKVIHVISSNDQKEAHKTYLEKLSKASNKKLNW